jgi:hypothetical protein
MSRSISGVVFSMAMAGLAGCDFPRETKMEPIEWRMSAGAPDGGAVTPRVAPRRTTTAKQTEPSSAATR